MWVGYPDKLIPMTTDFNGGPVLGGTFPALIWHDFMTSALQIDKTRAEEAAAKGKVSGGAGGETETGSTSEETPAPSSSSSGSKSGGGSGSTGSKAAPPATGGGHSGTPATGGGRRQHASGPGAGNAGPRRAHARSAAPERTLRRPPPSPTGGVSPAG